MVKLTPRQERLLNALQASDWVWREDVDRIAGASNGPEIIAQLRLKLTGHDGIDTHRVDSVDRDGNPCRPGRYRLNDVGRARLNKLLGDGRDV
jgi:hypothetical protein